MKSPILMDEIFSEYFARKGNRLTRVDPRIKILFAAAAIVTVLLSSAAPVPLAIVFLATVSLLMIGIPFKILLLRLSAPLGIALTVLCMKILFFHQALGEAILIVSKIVASTSLILFLSMITSVDKILAACAWFQVPDTWIEICLIAYRYLFVLWEDAVTVVDAQKVRLGYSNLRRSLQSVGILAGATIVRAYDQSVATYEAMMLRGYRGKAPLQRLENKLKGEDAAAALIFAAVLAGLIFLNHVTRAS